MQGAGDSNDYSHRVIVQTRSKTNGHEETVRETRQTDGVTTLLPAATTMTSETHSPMARSVRPFAAESAATPLVRSLRIPLARPAAKVLTLSFSRR